LGTAIKGDDLYGLPNDRLYLHAEQITFTHPVSGKTKTITCKAPF
jgi:tRNA pseudouridine32 synthase/23S rRNA pseudouridine746 synthase